MKLKKLLAAVTAAALAVSPMAVTSFTASAADDVELSTEKVSLTDLQKYDKINITVKSTAIPDCGHERGTGDGKHNDTDTYCSWGQVVVVGDDSNGWFQPIHQSP